MTTINVTSEYKKLKRVLLHRPGRETENLTPSTYNELLFDDAYFLPVAQREHDNFAKVLRDNGVEVVYLEDLITEVLDISPEIKTAFIEQFVYEGKVDRNSKLFPHIVHYLKNISDTKEMVLKMMEGVRYSEIHRSNSEIHSLAEISAKDELFVLKPLPNLIFTRDPFSTIGHGISLHTMHYETRKRETLFAYFIFKYHPEYASTKQYFNRDRSTSLEGGDVMILTENEIAVGISQRTHASSIEKLAEGIFSDKQSKIHTIYAIDIPKGRSWMHLDTVFTQIDVNKFAIFTDYAFNIYKLTRIGETEKFVIKEMNSTIEELMKNVFKERKVNLIYCGNGDPLASEREQWNDGSNVLAIAPNTIITYDRNYVTNKGLIDAGVNVIQISSSELSRGRGGPRCMSMPLIREN